MKALLIAPLAALPRARQTPAAASVSASIFAKATAIITPRTRPADRAGTGWMPAPLLHSMGRPA